MLSRASSIVTLVLVVILVLCLIAIACCATVEPFTLATPVVPKKWNACVTYEANPYGNDCPSFDVNKPIYLNQPVTAHGGLMVDGKPLKTYLQKKVDSTTYNPAIDSEMKTHQNSIKAKLTEMATSTSKLESSAMSLQENLKTLQQTKKSFLQDVTKGLAKWQPVYSLGSSSIPPWYITQKQGGANVKDAHWISYSKTGTSAVSTAYAIMYKNTFFPCQTQQQKMGQASQDPRTYTLNLFADNYATNIWINDQFVGTSSTENWSDCTQITIHVEPPENNDGTTSTCSTTKPKQPTVEQAHATQMPLHIPQKTCTVYTKTPLRIYIVVMNYGTSPITKTPYGNGANPHGVIATLKDINNTSDVVHTDGTWEYCVVDSAAVMMKILAEAVVETVDEANTSASLCSGQPKQSAQQSTQ